jgi:hypothetical protein
MFKVKSQRSNEMAAAAVAVAAIRDVVDVVVAVATGSFL